MKRPKAVEIGGITFNINYTTPKKSRYLRKGKSELFGCIDLGKRKIYLDKNHKDILPFILFHEVLHAAIAIAGGLPEDDKEEEFVTSLGHTLFGAMKSADMLKLS